MTPGELARRKKIQADLSIVGGTLGLTALGAKGASAGLRRAGKTVAAARTEKPVVGLLTGGAGIGGVGAFNFAATQRAEAAGVRPKSVVKKNYIYAPNEDAAAKIKAARPGANVIIGSPPKKKSAETREQRVARQAAQQRQVTHGKAVAISDYNPKPNKGSFAYRLSNAKIPGGRVGAGLGIIGAGAGAGYAYGKLSKRDDATRTAATAAGATYGTYLGGGYALSAATKKASLKDKKSNEIMGRHRKSMGIPIGSLVEANVPKKKIEEFYRTTPREVKFSGVKRVLARTHGVSVLGRMGLPVVAAGATGGYMYEKGKVSKAKKRVTNNDLAIAGGATAAATGARFSGQTSVDGVKAAMRESAKTNYKANRELLGQGKVRSAARTVKAQLRANPARMSGFDPGNSKYFKATEKLMGNLLGDEAAKEMTRGGVQEMKNRIGATKGFGAKYYAKKPLLVGGAAVAAGAYANKKYKLAKAYDPEKNRARRADVYTGAAGAGALASSYKSGKKFYAAGGAGHVRQAIARAKLARTYEAKAKSRVGRTGPMNASNDKVKSSALRQLQRQHVVSAGKIVRSRGVLAPIGVATALAGTAGAIQYQKKNSGRTYTNWYDGKKRPKFSRVDNTTATSN